MISYKVPPLQNRIPPLYTFFQT